MLRACIALWCGWLVLLSVPTSVGAQAQPQAAVASTTTEPDARGTQWFVGAYYRHNWMPAYAFALFFSHYPIPSNDGFGLVVSRRAENGVTMQLGLGYMPYFTSGAFSAKSFPIEDTEYVRSDLALWHLTGALLWPIEFSDMFALEIGVGLDFGFFTGDVIRDEAYRDPATGRFYPCTAANMPDIAGPDTNANGPIKYCDVPSANGRNVDAQGRALDPKTGQPIITNTANEKGEQYHVREPNVPPAMVFPMLPVVALRFAPHPQIVFKLEASFGVAQVWVGASIHAGFGEQKKKTVVPVAVVAPPPVMIGRVLGKVLDATTNAVLSGVTVKTSRAASALQSDDNGLFVLDKLDPGQVSFELSHPDYEPGTCTTEVPAQGGDVSVSCTLTPRPTDGTINGHIQDEQGTPISGAQAQISGPIELLAVTGGQGNFSLSKAPVGTYRVRVDAAGYLMQVAELKVEARQTLSPTIIMIKKPSAPLVTLKAKEIYIKQQINFATDSTEIGADSEGLMREIADVMLRNDGISLIEIQGHTDNSGGREHNQELSQGRADAVRAWLLAAGVAESRLVARGYGQDKPLMPNKTAAAKAKNRRVQFIILQNQE